MWECIHGQMQGEEAVEEEALTTNHPRRVRCWADIWYVF